MRGRKSSQNMTQLLRELHNMRGNNLSTLLMKKNNDISPLEDASFIEKMALKSDASLYMIGSNQKKRPDNLILGRMFDGHVLDMFELGVEEYKGCNSFKSPEYISKDLKPILMFQGDVFENSDKHKRLKNLLIDMFKMQDVAKVEIEALQRVLVFTCSDIDSPIDMRHLECVTVTEHLAKRNAVPFNEVGPSCKMHLRRDKMAGVDLYKDACRKPKVQNVEKKKERKNKFNTDLGVTMGKVFVQN